MNDFWREMLLSGMRHSLGGVAVYAVAHGFIDQGGADSAIAGVSALTLALWKWYDADGKAEMIILLHQAIVMIVCLFLAGNAYAVDLTKAPPIAKATCTLTSCVGVFIGGSIANDGGNLDVIGTGLQGVANNQSLGSQFGLEYFRNNIYAAGLIHVNYDMALNTGGLGITDKVSFGVCGRLGYSLASFFGAGATGQAAPTLPQQLAASLMTPYVNICEDRRHGQPAIGTGAGVEALVSQNWTANADYLHYTFNQGGNAGGVVPLTQKDENAVMFSINYHLFNW
jgi:opacity protein-like surface antigen